MKKVKLSILFCCLMAVEASTSTLEGLPGTQFSPSAQPLGHLGLTVSLGALGHQDESTIRNRRFFLHETGKSGDPDTAEIQDLQSGMLRLNAAMGLGPYVDIGLSLPYYMDFIGDTRAQDLSGAGIGDPALFLKAGRALAGDHVLDAALLGSVTVPSKNKNGFLPKQPGYVPAGSAAGAPLFFSSGAVGGSIQSLFTLDLSRLEDHPPFRASLNGGASSTGAAGASGRALLGGGVEWLPLPSLEFFGDLQSETRFSQADALAKIGKEYSFLAAGFTAASDDGIFFSVSVQKSLSQRPFHAFAKGISGGVMTYDARYQPGAAIAVSVGWSGALITPDTDGDGINDKDDQCPTQPEDRDGFQDQDGCPDLDNDSDGIPDVKDKCPNDPEDKDGFQDEDGCPDPDNDNDGICDPWVAEKNQGAKYANVCKGSDKCPNEPEDKDGFQDEDGCPELDNDKDGIPDQQDKCPNEAEDKDGFQDADGCPDPDNDNDGICDPWVAEQGLSVKYANVCHGSDKCPNEPETINGFEDADGCPDITPGSSALPPLEKRVQLRLVRFRGNTAALMPESYASLDTLAKQIKATPGVMVEIRGYMDDAGGELEIMHSSEARATAVRKYLVSIGVPGDQVLARGMGSRDPIASNHTAAGRAQNRRIEVHRLN